jgi:hypothetical protein
VAPSGLALNHLLFADDSLLLFKVSDSSAREVNDVLEAYYISFPIKVS